MVKNDELYQHGIKGQKWGRRRYQNPDGTLTEAGKKRYASESSDQDSNGKDGKKKAPNPDKWVDEDISRTERLTGASKNLASETHKAVKSTIKKPERLKLDEISDKDLRDKINRELLERQFNEVFNPPVVSNGKQKTMEILETAGVVLSLAGSALGVAKAFREFGFGGGNRNTNFTGGKSKSDSWEMLKDFKDSVYKSGSNKNYRSKSDSWEPIKDFAKEAYSAYKQGGSSKKKRSTVIWDEGPSWDEYATYVEPSLPALPIPERRRLT